MNKIISLAILAFAITTAAQAQDVYHQGYYNSYGTYVQPHYQTRPDSTVYNNYSTYPNINPYTGQVGTKHYNSLGSYGSTFSTPTHSDPGFGYSGSNLGNGTLGNTYPSLNSRRSRSGW